MEVANRIVIFSRGNLEQIGSPREVYEQPANEFVARFIGVMNVLELDVRDRVDFQTEPTIIPGALHLTTEELERRHLEIPRERDIILYCT